MFSIILNVLFGIYIAIVLELLANGTLSGMTVQAFLLSFMDSLFVGAFITTVIPVAVVGNAVGSKLGLKNPNSIGFHAVRTLVVALIAVTLLSLSILFMNFGAPAFIYVWVKMYPILLAVGYIGLFIFLPLTAKLVTAICSKD